MLETDLLKEIRTDWLRRSNQSLASVSSVSENLNPELERFFELLEKAVATGDPGILDPLILEWSYSQTITELQSSASSIIEFLNKLMISSIDSAQASLPEKSALALVRTLILVFGSTLSRAADLDTQVKLTFTSNQLAHTHQDLEKLDYSKSDFIAVSAHELKTPLTLIDGYASMLRESLEGAGLNSYQSVLLEGIQHGTQRLHEIINDMIDASLIDNHVLNLSFQPVWINQLVSIIESETKLAMKERQLQLEIVPFDGMNQMTYGDPERLLQVLRIVLTNAIKFTPDGGNIIISGRKLPGFVEITISDNGIGIDPEYLLLIFEKFIRLGTTALHSSGKTKYKGGGPGLGLHIAKGIIENHGGTIWADSPGFDELTCPGSTFHIMIPVRAEPPDEKSAKLFAPLLNNSGEKGKQ